MSELTPKEVNDKKALQSKEAQAVSTEVSSSGTTIQIYTNAVALQPPIKSPSFPHIQEHLTKAKNNAKLWTVDYQPKIFQSLTNIIEYGNQFKRYFPKLHKAAENADDPHYRDQLIGGMSRLGTKVKGFSDDAVARKDSIVTFYGALNEDHLALKEGLDKFERKLSNEGTIKRLKDRIAALQQSEDQISDTISDLWIGYAAATTAATVGGIFVFTGIGALVMGGAIYGAVETKSEIDEMEKQLHTVIQQKNQAQEELHRVNQDVAFATRYRDSLEGLVMKSGAASQALTSEMNCWDLLKQGFDSVEKGLKEADVTSFFIPEDLSAANDNWVGATQLAEVMRTSQALPVKKKELAA